MPLVLPLNHHPASSLAWLSFSLSWLLVSHCQLRQPFISDPFLTHTMSWINSPFYAFGLNLELQVMSSKSISETHTYICVPLATPRTFQLPLSSVSSPKCTHTTPGFPISQWPCDSPTSVIKQTPGYHPCSPPLPPSINPHMNPPCLPTLLHCSHLSVSTAPGPIQASSSSLDAHPAPPCSQTSTHCLPPVPQLQVQALSCLVSTTPLASFSLLQVVFVTPTKPSWWPKHPWL